MDIKRLRLLNPNSFYMSKYGLGWRAIKHAEMVKRKKAKVGIMKRIYRALFKKQKKTSLMGVREVRSMRAAHA